MFHQYNNVIKIKLTRPAVSALWIGAAEGNCEGKIILGSRTIALDDINRAILQSRPPPQPTGRPADLGSRERFNAAGVVVSACMQLPFASSSSSSSSPSSSATSRPFPSPPSISSILMRVVFIPCTLLTRSIHEFVEMSVLVLEPEVRACSVVSSRSSSLFCTMTSVYLCFSPSYVYLLFYPLPRIPRIFPNSS